MINGAQQVVGMEEELMMLGISGMCNQQGLLMDWL